MRWEQRVQFAARTDVGMRRQNNEDSHIERLASGAEEFQRHGHLFVVADGMGGHAVGELASKLAVETVAHLTFVREGSRGEALRESLTSANTQIHERGQHNRDFERMGTTCTALSLSPSGAVVGHVGDSRAYRIRRDRIDQLTFDHSVEWEVRRRHRGRVSEELLRAHRNVITRSLGPEAATQVDVEGPLPVLPGDRYLLCSDGLTGLVEDNEIGAIVRVLPPKEAARLLVDLANLRGGNDNCTVSIIEVGELPHGVPPPEFEAPTADWSLPLPWLAGWLVAAFLLCFGGLCYVIGRPYVGVVLGMFGLGTAGLVAIGTLRHRRRAMLLAQIDDDSRTMHTRPHATAIAMPLPELISELQLAAGELTAAAREDDWPIDWTKHDAAAAASREAAEERRFAVSLREVGRQIHHLMRGLQQLRTQARAT